MRKYSLLLIVFVISAIVSFAACTKSTSNASNTKPIVTAAINNVTATLSNASGQLKQGDQELTLAFTDSSGKAVDAGAVSLNFHMPAMGGMSAMNEAVTLTTTNTVGIYNGKVNVPMAGEWQGQLAIEGPAGKGKGTFSVTAR